MALFICLTLATAIPAFAYSSPCYHKDSESLVCTYTGSNFTFSRLQMESVRSLAVNCSDSSSKGENYNPFVSLYRLTKLEFLNYGCSLSWASDFKNLKKLKVWNSLQVNQLVSSVPPRVDYLDLSENHGFLTFSMSKSSIFSCASQLISLNLSHNGLHEISSGMQSTIPNCANNNRSPDSLKELDLHNNSLSNLPAGLLTEHILSLDLSYNEFTRVEPGLLDPLIRLVVLKLSHNKITQLGATDFKNLISVQALHLNNNEISVLSPGVFHSLNNLHILDLSYNALTVVGDSSFAHLVVLKQLYLDHNRIYKIGDKALSNCTSLNDLGLAYNALDEVPTTLSSLHALTSLDIGENRISYIRNDSFSGLGQLYGLRLVENRISEVGPGFCNHLKNLRALNVAKNFVSKVSSQAFIRCTELRALRLDGNSLTESVSSENQLQSLLWLNVSQNHITKVNSLPPKIEWFDVSYNKLSVLNLERYSTLRVLDASHNNLTYLNRSVFPSSVELLKLNNNKIESIEKLTFIRNTGLRKVELNENKLISLPLTTVRVNPNLTMTKTNPEFHLSGNPFQCDCNMEWVKSFSEVSNILIPDLSQIMCTDENTNSTEQTLVDKREFLCSYKTHCFALCHCCEFDACDCEMSCPDGCTCAHNEAWTTNVVTCTAFSGNNSQMTELPLKLPMDATTLYLDGNNFPSINPHVFIGKKNLQTLFLNNSKISTLHNKSFNGLKSVQTLHLENNELTSLTGNEFQTTPNLMNLFLNDNRLTHIGPATFASLRFLQVLRLDNNMLIDFPVWNLGQNNYLSAVRLAGNSWSCECEFLQRFISWAHSRSIVGDFHFAMCMDKEHGVPQSIMEFLPKCAADISRESIIALTELQNNELEDSLEQVNEIQSTPHLSSSVPMLGTKKPEETTTLTILLVLIGLLIAALMSIVLLLIRRRYANRKSGQGWIPCMKTGDSTDSTSSDNNKLFDAYFLYTKTDSDFILEKIAPELESLSTKSCRLCLHYRDLCAVSAENTGELIKLAAEASCRVVVFVSKDFLSTEWRYFVESGLLKNNCVKLVFVLLPPFSSSNVPTSHYVDFSKRFNSNRSIEILEWPDRSFWPRLKSILPSACIETVNPLTLRRPPPLPPMIYGSSLSDSNNHYQPPSSLYKPYSSSYNLPFYYPPSGPILPPPLSLHRNCSNNISAYNYDDSGNSSNGPNGEHVYSSLDNFNQDQTSVSNITGPPVIGANNSSNSSTSSSGVSSGGSDSNLLPGVKNTGQESILDQLMRLQRQRAQLKMATQSSNGSNNNRSGSTGSSSNNTMYFV